MLSPSLNSRSRLIWRVLAVILTFLLIRHFLVFRRSDSDTWPASKHGKRPLCDSLQALDDVLVIMKTGANEAPEKLPIHFETTLKCVPHYVVYSDMEEEIAGHHVHNVLDDVNPEVIANHPDFEYYKQLQAQGRDAFTPQQMAEWASAKNTGGGRDSPGWRLDKWKFLPAAEKAYKLRPEAKWFIFIESDTYVVWSAFLKWISRFDASRPQYLGQQMQIGDVVFAYGGAGFAISNPALKKVVELRESSLDYYDDFTGNHWAGDCVLGKALADSGIDLFWSWPTLISDHPADMDFLDNFGGADKKLWCYYAASYHHLRPADISRLNSFETNWRRENSTLLRHGDFFRHYLLPQMSERKSDWDNMSKDEAMGDTTFEGCRAACEAQSDCVQYSYASRTCRISTEIKLGRSTAGSDSVTSGWMMDRVHKFAKENDKECRREDFVLPY